jgi:hypothetical protein
MIRTSACEKWSCLSADAQLVASPRAFESNLHKVRAISPPVFTENLAILSTLPFTLPRWRPAIPAFVGLLLVGVLLNACKAECPPGTKMERGSCVIPNARAGAEAEGMEDVSDGSAGDLGTRDSAKTKAGTAGQTPEKKSSGGRESVVAGEGGAVGMAASTNAKPATAGGAGGSESEAAGNTNTAAAGTSGGTSASGAPGVATSSGAGAGGEGGGEPRDSKPACGNGMQEAGEVCDGNCPDTCAKPANACIASMLTGSANACDAECKMVEISACKNGDGCCPKDCKHASDDDCSVACGDGVVDAPELCESKGTSKPCPTDCDDGDPCTKDMLVGSSMQCSAQCVHSAITAARGGDGCCPNGANANSDSLQPQVRQ